MASTRIQPHQIDRFCRVPGDGDYVLVVLVGAGRFRFCGRTILRESQCVLEPEQGLEPAAFLARYGDDLPEAARGWLEG